MIDDKIKDRLESYSGSVPSVPEIILRVKEISEDPKSSAADLANIILSDHNLTARILKLANSAFYAEFSGKVATVTQAIVLMGFRTVRNVVMSIAIHDTFTNSSKIKNFNFRRFWTKSIGCGVIGKSLAKACRYKVPEEAFIAGFIHDIGKVIFSQVFRNEYPRIEKLIEAGEDEVQTERDLVGTDHCVVGAWFGRKWNLPEQIIAPIAHHHRIGLPGSTRNKSTLSDIIYIAQKCYAEVLRGNGKLDNCDGLFREASELLELKPESVRQTAVSAWDMIIDISVDLGIQLEQRLDSVDQPSATRKPVETGGDSAQLATQVPPPTELRLEMQQMSERLSTKEREISILCEASESIRGAGSVAEVLQTVLETIFRGLDIGRAVLFEILPDQSTAEGRVGFGVKSQDQVRQMVVHLKESVGAIRCALSSRSACNVLDATSRSYASVIDPDELTVLGAKAFAILPLSVDGKAEMVILVNNRNPEDPIDDSQLKSVQALIAQAETVIEKQRLIAKLNAARGDEVKSLIDTAFS
jgi:HD-like signal output (HDOD) protein